MQTIAEIRLLNLDLLIEEFGTQDKVSELGGTSSVYLSQIRNQALDAKTGKPREMGSPISRKLEIGCGKERGWMDHLHGVAKIDGANHGSLVYQPQANDETTRTMLAAESVGNGFEGKGYDQWTQAALDLMLSLRLDQREGALAALRTHKSHLDPPRDGQTLPMAA
jgi:hypothetical protein